MKHSISSLLNYGRENLQKNGIDSYHIDSRLILQFVTNFTHEEIIANANCELEKDQVDSFIKIIKRRIKREPISQIIGEKEFWDYKFVVTKDTLTPRPDSETLIETCLKLFPNKKSKLKILDLGTGTGCLIITLLKEYINAMGIGIDLSREAIKIAQKNSQLLKVNNRLSFINANWADCLNEKFDLIISNPPYIADKEIAFLPEEVKYDPINALKGGEDGLDCYREILKNYNLLNADGFIVIEIGQNQYEDIKKILNNYMYKNIDFARDLNKIIRCVYANKPI